jgi:hypothetical protein
MEWGHRAGHDSSHRQRTQTVSVPAGATVQFQFFVLHNDKSVTSENIKHSYTIPLTGAGTAAVTWQH